MGVASSSQRVPIKRGGFDLIDEAMKDADCYCAWKFVYYANRWNRAVGTGAANPPGAPGTFTPGGPGTLNPGSPSFGGAPGTIQPGSPDTSNTPTSPGSN